MPELPLDPDEVIQRESPVTLVAGMSDAAVGGTLTLTNKRLAWRVMGAQLLKKPDRLAGQLASESVTGVSLIQIPIGPFWRWIVRVDAGKEHHRFEPGGEVKAREWLRALREWADLSHRDET
jgi:hypothetical protein